jgi:hypothetical protein
MNELDPEKAAEDLLAIGKLLKPYFPYGDTSAYFGSLAGVVMQAAGADQDQMHELVHRMGFIYGATKLS